MLHNPNIRYVPIQRSIQLPGEPVKREFDPKTYPFYQRLIDEGLKEDANNTLFKIVIVHSDSKYHPILKFIFGADQDTLTYDQYELNLNDVSKYVTHFERLREMDLDIDFVNSPEKFKLLKLDFMVDASGKESLFLIDMYAIQSFPYKSVFNLEFLNNKIKLPIFTYKEAFGWIERLIKSNQIPRLRPYSEFVRDFTVGLQSVYLVLSCIEAESGIKQKMKNPWEDFEAFKVYLDPKMVRKIETTYVTKKSNQEKLNNFIGESLSERYADRLPPIDFDFSHLLNFPTLQYLLDLPATWGALCMAANELGFELPDLIRSPQVNYMFAQFVARKWISPKQVGFVSGVMGNNRQFRISSGLQMSMANEKWIMGCKLWFKSVAVRKDPLYYRKWEEVQRLISPFQLDEIPQTVSEFNSNRKFDSIRDRRDTIFEARQELWALALLPSVLEK